MIEDPKAVDTYLNWMVVGLAFSVAAQRQWATILCILIMLIWWMDGRVREKVLVIVRDPLWRSLLLFIALNVISLLWSADPIEGFSYLGKYRYLLLAPMVATVLLPKYRRATSVAFVTGVVFSLVLSVLAMAGLITTKLASAANPSVTMSHLDYSMVLAVAALLLLNHLFHNSKGRRCTVVLLVLCGAGLFLNIGRSGQFAFFGTLFVMSFFVGPRPRRWIFRAAPLAVLLLFVGIYSTVPVFHERVNSAWIEVADALSGRDFESNQGMRIAGLIVAADMFKADPVLGTGVGANMSEFRRVLDDKHSEFQEAVSWFPHMHNQYLQVVTELGIVGLVFLVNIFVNIFRRGFPDQELQRGAWIVGIAYIFGFMGDPFFQKQLPVVLFALALGVLAVAPVEAKPTPEH